MHTTRTYLIGAGLVMAGFGLGWAMPSGNVEAQKAPDAPRPVAPRPKIKPKDIEKPKDPWAREDGLPSFAYQEYKWQKKYATGGTDTPVMDIQIPDMPRNASRESFEKHSEILTILDYYKGNPGDPATVRAQFKNVELLHFMRLDHLERELFRMHASIQGDSSFWSSLSGEKDTFWGEHNSGLVVLPPPERDDRSDEYTWEIKRHKNGRVKTVTPYIGETEKRTHGIQLEYNEEGNLIRMTPFVNGKRHGTEKLFEGNSRARLQEAKDTKEWNNGLQVVEKAVPKIKVPAPKK